MWPFSSEPPELPSGKATTTDGNEVELVLYKFDSCPFCQRVFKFLKKHPVPLTYRDTRTDEGAAAELTERGGMQQVPCLFIDGEALYESLDIIDYLENNIVAVD